MRAKLSSPEDLQREVERLRRERDRLRGELERLTHALEAARGAGKHQPAPFSKGAPTPRPNPAGRRPGRHHGRHAHRQPPPTIHETIEVPLPASCPDCGWPILETRVAAQVQEDLPVVATHVRRFGVHIGHCVECGACRDVIRCRPPMRWAR